MNYEKLFNTDVNSTSLKEWRAKGKKAVGTICCHVPEEIIHAAGVLPVRLRATGCKDSSSAEAWMSSFSCSYARSCLQYLMDGTYELDGIISTDGCLMAGRIYDNWEHMSKNKEGQYFQHFAAPRMLTDRSIKYYKEELLDVKKGLEEFTGEEITDEKLQASIEIYNETRALIRKLFELRKEENPKINGEDTLKIILASTSMRKEEFNELLKAYFADLDNIKPITNHRARLIVIGSALDDPEYMKVIEDKGGLIVTDALCFGSRYLWEPVAVEGKDIYDSIAKSYLERPVCPRMIDLHDELGDFILKMAKDYNVDGVLYQKMQNCECWGGESTYLEERLKEANLPVLTVEREELMANAGQLAIRVEAFVEMIEKED